MSSRERCCLGAGQRVAGRMPAYTSFLDTPDPSPTSIRTPAPNPSLRTVAVLPMTVASSSRAGSSMVLSCDCRWIPLALYPETRCCRFYLRELTFCWRVAHCYALAVVLGRTWLCKPFRMTLLVTRVAMRRTGVVVVDPDAVELGAVHLIVVDNLVLGGSASPSQRLEMAASEPKAFAQLNVAVPARSALKVPVWVAAVASLQLLLQRWC